MAKRGETDRKKAELEEHLRALCEATEARHGQPLPPHRDLAKRFGLSTFTVYSVVQALVDEGLVHSEPGIGVFARRPAGRRSIYVFQIDTGLDERARPIHNGFSQEMALRGELSIILSRSDALACRRLGQGRSVAGAFSFFAEPDMPQGRIFDVPYTGVYGMGSDSWDTVVFDDVDGGWLATRHLIECGHRTIAFLGANEADGALRHSWAEDRHQGWERAMAHFGLVTDGLFLPKLSPVYGELTEAGRQAAPRLMAIEGCTAVVAANNEIASGFLNQLRSMEVPLERWPAIVGFQDSDAEEYLNISALYLAYEDLGRVAARLLLDRSAGQIEGPPTERKVPMRLLPRLTSYPGWAKEMAVSANLLAVGRS
jgi:DNA-binding MarR family transcriptional regulator